MQAVAATAAALGLALIAVGGPSWELPRRKYVLEAVLRCEYREDGPRNQWVGELQLPHVEFAVTAQMPAN